jgi:tight adherence protein C
MILILLMGLFLVAAAIALIARSVQMPRLRTEHLLGTISGYGFSGGPPEVEAPSGTILAPLDDFASLIGITVGRLLGFRRQDEIRRDLRAAGMYGVEPRRIVGYQIMAGIVMGLLWIWLAANTSMSPVLGVLGTLICGFMGWYVPMMLVRRRARYRLDQIEYELPELIYLLAVAVEAGLGFSAAMAAAVERMPGPLGEEMRLMLQEQTLGLTPLEALENVLTRVDTPSLRTFVRSIVQGEQLGISIGDVLRNLALEMRKRRKAAAEERAQKAPIKMLFPLVFLIFPAMFVVILGPAMFAFFDALGK